MAMNSHPAELMYADCLEVRIFSTPARMGACAADAAAATLTAAIDRNGAARVVVATGASQFPFYDAFVQCDVDWNRLEVLHLDEYVGLSPDHPASFRRYLRDRFVEIVWPKAFFGIEGDAEDVDAACEAYARRLAERPVDLCVCGIGENGHLAFNDPPVADFEDEKRVKKVELDEACRRQQLGEGWFESMDVVPTHALTLTIPAVLSANRVLVLVPEQRKADAVHGTVCGPIETACPASVLRRHAHASLFLDADAASRITSGH